MKMFKKILTAAAITAVMAASAQAATINVGGVSWDPDSPFDFTGTTATIYQNIAPLTLTGGGTLSGYGYITQINNQNESSFCKYCELTFTYSGFTPIASSGNKYFYKDGTITIFVDTSKDTNTGQNVTQTTAGNGTPWLELKGHNGADPALPPFTSLEGENKFPDSLQGNGWLDVVSGLAAGNFDTNSRLGGSDFSFTTTFNTFFDPSYTGPNPRPRVTNPNNAFGSGTFKGESIPEPASLALFGLGLAGLAAARRRKAAK